MRIRQRFGPFRMQKMDAMWKASEKFACSYEYIRKCMYYYKDINLC